MIEGDHSKRTHDGTEDEAGMKETLDDLSKLIDAEVADGIDPGRIAVGGFCESTSARVLSRTGNLARMIVGLLNDSPSYA